MVGQTYSRPEKPAAAFVREDGTHSVRSKYNNLGLFLKTLHR